MTTTLWAAQDALVAALRTHVTAGVPVTLGEPANLETTHVWVSGSVDDWTDTFVQSNLAVYDEEYSLVVRLYVARDGDYATSRTRMQTLLAEVKAAIRADFRLGGAVSLATVTKTTLDEGLTDSNARAIECTMYVRCQADAVT